MSDRKDFEIVQLGIACSCTVKVWDQYEIEPLEWNLCPAHAALDRIEQHFQGLLPGRSKWPVNP